MKGIIDAEVKTEEHTTKIEKDVPEPVTKTKKIITFMIVFVASYVGFIVASYGVRHLTGRNDPPGLIYPLFPALIISLFATRRKG